MPSNIFYFIFKLFNKSFLNLSSYSVIIFKKVLFNFVNLFLLPNLPFLFLLLFFFSVNSVFLFLYLFHFFLFPDLLYSCLIKPFVFFYLFL